MTKSKTILQLKGFPISLLGTEWAQEPLQSPAKLQRLAVEIYEGGCTAFCFNESGALLDRVLEDGGINYKDMLAVDFPTYMANVLSEGMSPIVAPFLYIYNVGGELANSTTYSDKLLTNLIKTNKARGNTTITCSDTIAPSLFTRNYPSAQKLIDTKTQIVRD